MQYTPGESPELGQRCTSASLELKSCIWPPTISRDIGHPGPFPRFQPLSSSLETDYLLSPLDRGFVYLQPTLSSLTSSTRHWAVHLFLPGCLSSIILFRALIHIRPSYSPSKILQLEIIFYRSLFSHRSNPLIDIVPVRDSNILDPSPLRCHSVHEEIVLSPERFLRLGRNLFFVTVLK